MDSPEDHQLRVRERSRMHATNCNLTGSPRRRRTLPLTPSCSQNLPLALQDIHRYRQPSAGRNNHDENNPPASTHALPTPPQSQVPQPASTISRRLVSERRSASQRARRERERQSGINPSHEARSIAQRRRREREREQRRVQSQQPEQEQASTRVNSLPTPPQTQGGTLVGARQRLLSQQRIGRTSPSDSLFLAGRRPYQEPLARHDLGRMNIPCQFCGAMHWLAEKLSDSSTSSPLFGEMCCNSGKIHLPPIPDPPAEIQQLFTSMDNRSKQFREDIWKYNRAFAFTSLGVNEDHSVNNGNGPPVFRICGELCHWSGALTPRVGQKPKYAQLYLYEPREALAMRIEQNRALDPQIMSLLQTILNNNHRYAPIYRFAHEILTSNPNIQDIGIHLSVVPGTDRRRYNLPTVDEVAMVIPTHAPTEPRDIILRHRDGPLHRVSDLHPAYRALQYPLLDVFGTNGWYPEMKRNGTNRRLSECDYVLYYMQVRRNEFMAFLRGGRLFCRYVVDMYASIDQNRLLYLEHNQSKLRASLYSGLEDAAAEGDDNLDLQNVGVRVVLPSSYVGGPRHMLQCYQDSLAIARHFRHVDLFLTMTCNPEWPEITQELFPGQTAYDRPDLVARVFQLKKDAVLEDIHKHGIFGSVAAYVYTIEFQKRGLPHMHSLIFLQEPFKLTNTDAIDSCIWARWPDPEREPQLFEAVKRCMVHGPCGALNPNAPCMENGRCTKGYPKPFQDATSMDRDGYPLYYRPDDGRAFEVRGHMVDNRWIVPYSPYILSKYFCHANCECAISLGSFKYVFKYIQKGPDMATIEVNRNNEIQRYQNGKYISPPLATWRIFKFEIHKFLPNVVRLQVHLPGQHMTIFDPNESIEQIRRRAANEFTKLTAFFEANAAPGMLGEAARKLTYQEFPQKFTWKDDEKRWALRQSGFALGRMYFVQPTAGERFYLRTLLTTVRGPRSFDDLRTYHGVTYPSFHQACLARGLLEDDGEWRQCLREASHMQTGRQLRRLFATILVFCAPSEPNILWQEFRQFICDDLRHQLTILGLPENEITEAQIYDYGLYLLDNLLRESSRSLNDWPVMPQPQRQWAQLEQNTNTLIAEQLAYSPEFEERRLNECLPQLNHEQRDAYNRIISSVEQDLGQIFFVNGPGGTGKTFLYNAICNKVRSKSWIVLSVASSGIAALLIRGGRTAHSTFRIPIEGLSSESMCQIPKESARAELLRATKLIIWDETGAQHRYAPEAVDRTLRDIRGSNKPFGGITMVFGGDFQQTLPVIPRGSRDDIVNATLQCSYLWEDTQILRLRQNMRLDNADPESIHFSQWLLDIGHGKIYEGNDQKFVRLPDHMLSIDVENLIESIYPNINSDPPPPPDYFLNRMILAPRNSDVTGINESILKRVSGEEHVYISADEILEEDGSTSGTRPPVPVEFLRSINSSNLPPGELPIKIGCPLILLRNLAPSQGLCNGTRMVVTQASERVLQVRLIGGDHDGELAFIPRISLIPTTSAEYTFKFKRRQFPVRLAFALTINKSQGQSVKYVGLDLRNPVFSHGQLYVALSRATSPHRVKALLPDAQTYGTCLTSNVVYPEVLLD